MSEAPYIFVTRGDIAWIQADVIVLPSWGRGGTGGVYRAMQEKLLTGRERRRFKASYDRREAWFELDRVQRPHVPQSILILDFDGGDANAIQVADVRTAVDKMLGLIDGRPRGKNRLRVAMPALGSGKGQGPDARALARAQVETLHAGLRDRSDKELDVVIVARSEAAYARFVDARAELDGYGTHERDQRLADLVRNERVVLFVGAGLSIGAGLPGWASLIAALVSRSAKVRERALTEWRGEEFHGALERALSDAAASDLTLPDDLEATHFTQIAQWFEELEDGRSPHVDVIDELLGDRATAGHPSTLAQYLLLQMPFRYVVTTNYDGLAERTLRHLRKRPRVVVENEQVATSGDPRWVTVFKIHGTARGEGDERGTAIVLTSGEYERFEERQEAKARLLGALLLNHHFLFIGYGLNDENLNDIREKVAGVLGRTQRLGWVTWVPGEGEESWKEDPGDAVEPIRLASFWDLDRWLDRLAAAATRREGAFLADATPPEALAPLHTELRALEGEGPLGAAYARRDSWTLEEVRVLARVVAMLADLGWREPEKTCRLHGWWASLAEAAERGDDRHLAHSLWGRALGEADSDKRVQEALSAMNRLEVR